MSAPEQQGHPELTGQLALAIGCVSRLYRRFMARPGSGTQEELDDAIDFGLLLDALQRAGVLAGRLPPQRRWFWQRWADWRRRARNARQWRAQVEDQARRDGFGGSIDF